MLNSKINNFHLETNANNIKMEIMPSGKFVLDIKNLSKFDVLYSNFSIDELIAYINERTMTLAAYNATDGPTL